MRSVSRPSSKMLCLIMMLSFTIYAYEAKANMQGVGSDQSRNKPGVPAGDASTRSLQKIQDIESRLAKIEATTEGVSASGNLPFELEVRRGIPEKSALEKVITSVPLLSVVVAIASLVVAAYSQFKLQKMSQAHALNLQRQSQDDSLRLQRESRLGQRQLEAFQKLWRTLDTIEMNYGTEEPLQRRDESILAAGPSIREKTLTSIRTFKAEEMFFLLPDFRATITQIEALVSTGTAPRRALADLIRFERGLLQTQLIIS
jgi:hypothetical protein